MTNVPLLNWKNSASLAFLGGLLFVSSASATLTSTADNTNSASAFTPAWPVAPVNLIAGLLPTDSFGNFTQESAGGLSKLTDGAIGPVTGTAIFATCGNNGGRMAIYDLPASANGFNITNITTYTGWGNGGRHAQAYTLYYSTKAAPRKFILLGSIAYAGGFTGNNPSQPSANRVIWADSTAGAIIAANAAAIMFDFNTPTSNGENGYSGYAEITVEGTASVTALPQVVAIATSNANGAAPFNPGWTLETPSLIAGMSPSSANGNFTQESPTLVGSRDVISLTAGGDLTITPDNVLASGNGTTSPNYVTCGGNGGNSLIYTLTNSINGSDVTNIVVYNGWADSGRHGQYYTVSYSTVGQPTTFNPISTVFYLPTVPGSTPSANRVAISSLNDVPLGSAVASLKFDFASPPAAGAFNNGYQGYAQIIVQGKDTTAPPPPPSPYLTQDTLPATAANIVGDQVVFTAAYSNAPPATLQWQKVSGGVTNDILGATTPTLTLNDLQVSDSGFYRLKAVNATNGAAAPSYSTGSPLTVSAAPAPVNGVINKFAAQTGFGFGTFTPSWTVDTNNSLIAGQLPSSVGLGNFSLEADGRVVDSLTAGGDGAISLIPNITLNGTTTSTNYVSCGISPAGLSVTYTLPVSANGYDLTNIVVYGGWADAGRDQQKYNIYYSTVANPSSFNTLELVDFNPANPANARSATRVSLVPSGTALAQNVAAVMFDFNLPGSPPENGWEGYMQIVVRGQVSVPKPILVQDITPLNASDVVGSQVTLTAGFSGATTYQWQKDGVNISGATATTLALSNLQLTDTATNSGYRVVASNGAGSTTSRACALTVIPASSATNNVVINIATQNGDAQSFGPTWTVAANSLIANASPSDQGTGNFNDPDLNPVSQNQAGGTPVLTDGVFGAVDNTGPHMSFATCGSGAGQFVVYSLDTNAFPNGYTLTNIMVGAGWNDGGRDQQAYTVYYATVANPVFAPLTSVNYNPDLPGGVKSFSRATITSPTGVLVSNVAAVMINFTSPAGENGYSGYDELAVYGAPSGAVPADAIVATAENQNTAAPTWIVEAGSLIANQLPSSVGSGNFQNEGGVTGTPALTDGTFGPADANASYATCGSQAGTSVTYAAPYGWDLTNIVVYSGWGNYDRDGQFYNVSYSTLAAPTTFLPLTGITYNPPNLGGVAANRVSIARLNGTPLATLVAAVKFDFTTQTGGLDNGYSGYAEIVLQGVNLAAPTAPTVNPPTVSGGNLILTGTGGTPNRAYTWLTTSNVALPLSAWTPSVTGVLDGTGSFSNAIPVNTQETGRFFKLAIP
jgi:hypothetical protein